jgi:NTE family protein
VSATALAPLAALALRSTALGGAALRRTAIARIPEGKRSLGGLGRGIDDLGVEWDGRLLVVALEVESGQRVVFGSPGATDVPVGRAVEASCAIPGVFRPIRARGKTYVDGGAWSLTNLDVAPVSDGTRVLCLNPTGSLGASASLRGAVGTFSRSVAGVEALVLQRRGAHVTTLAPDADAVAAMGANFMDASRRRATQHAAYVQGLRAASELAAAA